MTAQLWALAKAKGIAASYTDQQGKRRHTSVATRDALLAAMGCDIGSASAVAVALTDIARAKGLPPYHICTPDKAPGLSIAKGAAWQITREDGAGLEGKGPLPGLPLGRHRLRCGDDACWLLVAPPTLPLPARGWGVTAPLYGLRSEKRGGLATYADLADTAAGLGRLGAGFLGINPVHAGFEGDVAGFSPYSPSHRRRLAVMHLAFETEPPTPPSELVDYAAARPLRRQAAERAFAAFGGSDAFDAFCAREGQALENFALYEALAERHGPYWNAWPAALHDPAGAEARAFARAHGPRLRFHKWMQFEAETQLGKAADAAQRSGMAHGLYLDLAVGTHPHGAETWSERHSFAFGVSLGAPPDAFSPGGQSWTLAPFNPHALVDTGFAPLAATLRAQLRFARLLRIDHILGFDRAFWVPENGAAGGYVTMPRDAMLAVVRIEAARAGATIVGEDLGNIPPGLREDLAQSGVLGCRVMMFEGGRAADDYPRPVMASFGTHDLPTWVGWRSGRDIAARSRLGDVDAKAALADRRSDIARLDAETGGGEGVDQMHAHLAKTRARLVALQIEDILGIADQPNLPGTTDEYPNWRRRLPVDSADLAKDPRVAHAAAIMRREGR